MKTTSILAALVMAMMAAAWGQEAEPKPLFNGQDLTGWKGKWDVAEGALAWKKGCGDLWTEQKFGDFVLDFEYKVAKGTNSGVFIRTADPRDNVQTGIEIQIYDSHGQKPSKHSCGAMYDCLAASENAEKPAGEWNRMIITAKGGKVQVNLNGRAIIDADLDKWTEPKKNPDGSENKFNKPLKDFPREGYIGLQDHGGAVWYRNMTIKSL